MLYIYYLCFVMVLQPPRSTRTYTHFPYPTLFLSIYLAALEAIPSLRAQGGGCIVNTSSTAALRPRPGLTVYNASKGAVNVLTKSMAVELATDRKIGRAHV